MRHHEKPDVLMVTHRVPYPPDKGDRIRTYHTLRFLAQHANIHLATLADEPVSPETTGVLQGLCQRICYTPLGRVRWLNGMSNFALGGTISEGMFQSGALKSTIRAWAKETRFVGALASSSAIAHYLRVPELQHATKVVDVIDVDSQKWFDYAAATSAPKSWLYRIEGRRLRRTERRLTKWAHMATLVSTREAALLQEITGASNVRSVTCGVDLEYYTPTARNEAGCVFVGAMDYKPNVDGAVWFAQTVWPNLRHLHPHATFRIVGRKPAPAVQQLASIPGVEVVGQVPDVRPYVAEAAVVIAPLRLARGLQTKVLEALASGKCIVASPQALAGFDHDDALPALRCETSPQWLNTISQLFNDPVARHKLGLAGRQYAERYHNWGDCLAPLIDMLGLASSVATAGDAR